jgi:hypothetical protein
MARSYIWTFSGNPNLGVRKTAIKKNGLKIGPIALNFVFLLLVFMIILFYINQKVLQVSNQQERESLKERLSDLKQEEVKLRTESAKLYSWRENEALINNLNLIPSAKVDFTLDDKGNFVKLAE